MKDTPGNQPCRRTRREIPLARDTQKSPPRHQEMKEAKKGVFGIVPDGVYFVGVGRTLGAVMVLIGALMIGSPVGPSSLMAPSATGWYRPFLFPLSDILVTGGDKSGLAGIVLPSAMFCDTSI